MAHGEPTAAQFPDGVRYKPAAALHADPTAAQYPLVARMPLVVPSERVHGEAKGVQSPVEVIMPAGSGAVPAGFSCEQDEPIATQSPDTSRTPWMLLERAHEEPTEVQSPVDPY
jgi:hypothetical protein